LVNRLVRCTSASLYAAGVDLLAWLASPAKHLGQNTLGKTPWAKHLGQNRHRKTPHTRACTPFKRLLLFCALCINIRKLIIRQLTTHWTNKKVHTRGVG
jgi:hypothetical protein